jgi:hypothetical protein
VGLRDYVEDNYGAFKGLSGSGFARAYRETDRIGMATDSLAVGRPVYRLAPLATVIKL